MLCRVIKICNFLHKEKKYSNERCHSPSREIIHHLRFLAADDPNLLNTSLYNLCIFADKNDIFDKNEIIL